MSISTVVISSGSVFPALSASSLMKSPEPQSPSPSVSVIENEETQKKKKKGL